MNNDEYKKVIELEDEIKLLKHGVEKLCIVANGIDVELDKQLNHLKNEVKQNTNVDEIFSQITQIAKFSASIEEKDSDDIAVIHRLIQEFIHSFEDINLTSKGKSQLDTLKQNVITESSSNLINLFRQSLDNIVVDLSQIISNKNKSKSIFRLWNKQASQHDEDVIKPATLEAIDELLNNLVIPEDFSSNVEKIREVIAQEVNLQSLKGLIEDISELILETFYFDQNKVKHFLQQLTNRLFNVEGLVNAITLPSASKQETQSLQTEIGEKITNIKSSIDNAQSIDAISELVIENLDLINSSVEQYKQTTTQRIDEYQQQMITLQEKLHEAEISAEDLKITLSQQVQKANRDPLTQLPNRQSYDEHIIEAINRYHRRYGQLCLTICDLDHFKAINDNYGHLAGDKVLKKIAQLLKDSVRAVDFVGRFGGEEFVLIFANTSLEDSTMILEKIRRVIESCGFYFRNNNVTVTCSFGISTMHDDDSAESLFQRADDALYQAKESGRNQIITLEKYNHD